MRSSCFCWYSLYTFIRSVSSTEVKHLAEKCICYLAKDRFCFRHYFFLPFIHHHCNAVTFVSVAEQHKMLFWISPRLRWLAFVNNKHLDDPNSLHCTWNGKTRRKYIHAKWASVIEIFLHLQLLISLFPFCEAVENSFRAKCKYHRGIIRIIQCK